MGRGTPTADIPLRLGHEALWHGPSVYISLCPACHRCASALSSEPPRLPSCPSWSPNHRGVFPRCGTLSSPSTPSPHGCRSHSVFSFLLSFFHPTACQGIFLVLLSAQGILLVFSRCSVRTVLFADVFLMYLWGEVCSISPYSATLTPHRKVLEAF